MCDDFEDDEDWYDDESETEDEPTRCPECGGDIPAITDRCSACGYWLTESDRRAAGHGSKKPFWLRATAVVVLVVFLLSILGIAVVKF